MNGQVKEKGTFRMSEFSAVWVFNGGGAFPGGVFTTRELAEAWISREHLSGTLTAYPLNTGIYEWAVARGYFQSRREEQQTPRFIARFSSGWQEHYHYENGVNPGQEQEEAES